MPYRDNPIRPPSRFDVGDTVLVETSNNGVFIGRVMAVQWYEGEGYYYDVPRNPREKLASLYGEEVLSPYGVTVD